MTEFLACPPRGQLFADEGARVVWAGVQGLSEGLRRSLLLALAEQMHMPELRATKAEAQRARAAAALWEAKALLDAECVAAIASHPLVRGGADHPAAELSVENFRRLRREHGRADWPADGTLRRWIGPSWNDALRYARLAVVADGDALIVEIGPAFSAAECVQAVVDYATDTGDTAPTARAVLLWASTPDVRCRPGRRPLSHTPYKRLFGSWQAVLDASNACGVPALLAPVMRRRPQGCRGFELADIRAAVREVATHVGCSPNTGDYQCAREDILAAEDGAGRPVRPFPAYQTVRLRYRTWDEALVDAGLAPIRGSVDQVELRAIGAKRLTDADLLAGLACAHPLVGEPFIAKAYESYRRAQRALPADQRAVRWLPGYHTLWKRFGTWETACHLALGDRYVGRYRRR